MTTAGAYPVRVEASLDAPLSRWLWLVKWLLAIPHLVVLGFLWLAFAVLSVVAFFAILISGRYPRSIFEFNVGVLRWTWRVQYYSYGALGTDRYPPFTLAEVPDYPAHLVIAYPERLSRGLVLVKWWLLALPHYVVVSVFAGGAVWGVWRAEQYDANMPALAGGLIGLLVLFAAIVLLFTGRYPRSLYDFVLGMDRWVLRVAAYAALMTDRYPPFRMDVGGTEPGSTLRLGPPAPPPPLPTTTPSTTSASASSNTPEVTSPDRPPVPPPTVPPPTVSPTTVSPTVPPTTPPPPAPGQAPGVPPAGEGPTGWTGGRIVSLVIGAILALVSLGLLTVGGAGLWANQSQRDAAGYLSWGGQTLTTSGYALATEQLDLRGLDQFVGTVRMQVTPVLPAKPVFLGIAPAPAADGYLAGVSYTIVRGVTNNGVPVTIGHAGAAPAVPPSAAGIWTAQATGAGTQTLVWNPRDGHWTVVAMNADASQNVAVNVDVAMTIPGLVGISTGMLVAGVLVAAGAVALIVIPARRAAAEEAGTPRPV